MDKQTLAVMIPILALSIPVVAVIFNGLLKIQKMKLEEARLRHAEPAMLAELDDLRQEVQQLRGEVAEVQERMDFTERLLTSRTDQPR